MNSPIRSSIVALLSLAILFGASLSPSSADDKPDPIKFDTVFVVSKTVAKDEIGEFGLLHGGILLKDGRPEACFDLVAAKGEKPELVYLILFQSEKLAQSLEVTMQTASNGNSSRGKFSIVLAEKPLEIKYDFKLDAQAGKILERSLTLAGREWKSDGPRVFLADPSGDKVILKPVDVQIPADLPSPSDPEIKERMRQTIEAISRKSPEVRKFLGREPQ